MSVTYTVSIDIKQDGNRIPGFPVVKTVTAAESRGKSVINRASASGTYTELPLQELGDVTLLFVQADQAFNLRFNDQSDADLPISANGVVLLVDCDIPGAGGNKAALENESGSVAAVTVIAGGA